MCSFKTVLVQVNSSSPSIMDSVNTKCPVLNPIICHVNNLSVPLGQFSRPIVRASTRMPLCLSNDHCIASCFQIELIFITMMQRENKSFVQFLQLKM